MHRQASTLYVKITNSRILIPWLIFPKSNRDDWRYGDIVKTLLCRELEFDSFNTSMNMELKKTSLTLEITLMGRRTTVLSWSGLCDSRFTNVVDYYPSPQIETNWG